MDPIRFGLDIRTLRRNRGWTQRRLAEEAAISRSAISLLERGHGDRLTFTILGRVAAALGAHLSVRLFWHGEGLDRLRDRRHAAIVEQMIRLLQHDGWEVRPEVSFNEFGERGSIDILAFHPTSGALLVVEVKSVVPDLQEMLTALDRKARLAPKIAAGLGWPGRAVSRLLVFPDDRTARRRVEQHDATFGAAFAARSVAVKRWLRTPAEAISGLLFLSDSNDNGRRHPTHGREGGAARPPRSQQAPDSPSS